MAARVYKIELTDGPIVYDAFYLPKFKMDGTAAPTVDDDETDGWAAGSLWADRTNDNVYICTDNAAGAAQWAKVADGTTGGGVSDGDKGDVVVSGTGTVWEVESIAKSLTLKGEISPVLSADVNDWNPAGLADAAVIRIGTDTAAVNITGITGGVAGRVLVLLNVGDYHNTLKHESASSSAANRIIGHRSEDAILKGAGGAILIYDGTDSRWRIVTIFATPTGGSDWTTVKKTADETITNDATLTTDAALQFSMSANTKYHIKGRVFFDTQASVDFQWALTGPASPTLVRVRRVEQGPSDTADVVGTDIAYTTARSILTVTGTDGGWVEFDAIVHNGANSGTFGFQWAANSTDPFSQIIVRAGSYLEYATF